MTCETLLPESLPGPLRQPDWSTSFHFLPPSIAPLTLLPGEASLPPFLPLTVPFLVDAALWTSSHPSPYYLQPGSL